MSFKRLKKPHRGRKKGDVFLASKHLTGDPRRDVVKEAYLQSLIRETRTHDINEIWTRLDSEAKVIVKDLRETESIAESSQREARKDRAKLDVITEVIAIMKRIQSTGRTRVGESELKTIVSQVMRNKGIDPRWLGYKVI